MADHGDLLRQLGLSIPAPRTRPVYRHILRAFEQAMTTGRLTPGVRLPAERRLAAALGVSRATIVKVYQELETRGLARGYVGRGTFVSAAPDASGAPFAWRGKIATAALRSTGSVILDLVGSSSDPSLLSAAAGTPALDRFPMEGFKRSLDRVLRRDGLAVCGHGSTQGHPRLRRAIARRFGGQPENVLVVAGAQQGLDLLARCLIDPGDTVVIDRPGYLGALHTFRAAGARLVGWDVVRQDLDELEDLLVRYRPKLIYTNPTFQNPTGWTMPIRVRRDLLALAARHRVPIIEDDTYRELGLGAAPPPSLHSLDAQSIVIYLSTFSKMLAPGLRLGWLSAAEPIVGQLALIKQSADPQTQTLVQLVVSELVEQGALDDHIKQLRQEHRRRRDAVASALEKQHASSQLHWTLPEGGLYFWCRLPARVNAAAVLTESMTESVGFVAGPAFYVDHAGERELRLCFSGIRAERADEVVRRLLRAVATVRRDTVAQPPLMSIVK